MDEFEPDYIDGGGFGDDSSDSSSDGETEWFARARAASAATAATHADDGPRLPDPVGTAARRGDLGAPLALVHLAMGAVTTAMAIYGSRDKETVEGLTRMRTLVCLHVLLSQLQQQSAEEGEKGRESKRGRSREGRMRRNVRGERKERGNVRGMMMTGEGISERNGRNVKERKGREWK